MAKVAEIITFKDYTYIFKIIFKDNTTANKAMECSVLAFNIKITSAQMERGQSLIYRPVLSASNGKI